MPHELDEYNKLFERCLVYDKQNRAGIDEMVEILNDIKKGYEKE